MIKDTDKVNLEAELVAITKQLLLESGETASREIRLNASLQRHIGIDSLSRAELFQRIGKRFDVVLPDSLLSDAETLNDVIVYLRSDAVNLEIVEQHNVIDSHGDRPHINLSDTNTLIDVILMYGEKEPDKTHIYFQNENGEEEIITYGDLLKNSLRMAQGLRLLGLNEGETVAIMQPTHPRFFYTFLGVLLAGGVPVPIYPPFRMHMLEAYAKMEARILNNAEVRILVTFDRAENLSKLVQAFVPSMKHVVTAKDLMQPDSLETYYNARPDSFAFIQYTSGSTADPKGVLLTHYNLLSNIRAYGKAIQPREDDVAVSWLPLYHDLGLIGMWLGSLYHGIPLVLMTPFSFLNRPERWLWAIHRHRGTLSGAPNFAYELCINKIDHSLLEGLDLSSWRMAANGAEKVYPRTLEQFASKFAPYGFKRNALYPVYGLAESTVGLILPPVGREFHVDYVNRKAFEEQGYAKEDKKEENGLSFVSCGSAIEGHEVRIVDDKDHVLSERQVGSLQFRGPSNMQGYYNNPAATKATFHDDWIDSGDLAYEADGEIYITGRRKDLIIKAGRNLYPAEIEELVGNVEGVRLGCVAAFSATDERRATEQLIVVAETKEKEKNKLAALKQKINEALSVALDITPDVIVLAKPKTVPKTSSGKLQRAACKKMYLEGKLSSFQMPAWMQVIKLGVEGVAHKVLSVFANLLKMIYTVYVLSLVGLTLIPVYFVMYFTSREIAAKICRAWARSLLYAVFCPLRIENESRLGKTSPVIFASNHASYIDSVVALAVMPANTRIIGKKELFTTPIVRTFMHKLGFLGVDRMDLPKGIEDTRRIEEVLKEGSDIFIFPEGTFGYASGLRPFRLGAFKIATSTDTPVCPIAFCGTRSILRGNERLLRPGFIKAIICEPVYPNGNEWQDVTQLRDAVRSEISKHCGEASLDFIAAQTIASSHQGKVRG